jgi:hypothetical protein
MKSVQRLSALPDEPFRGGEPIARAADVPLVPVGTGPTREYRPYARMKKGVIESSPGAPVAYLIWDVHLPSGADRKVRSTMTTDDIKITDQEIKTIATANGTSVASTFTTVTNDPQGNEALAITIVLSSESAANNMPASAALNTLVQVHDKLLEKGDQRFPYITYTTEDDLKKSATDES